RRRLSHLTPSAPHAAAGGARSLAMSILDISRQRILAETDTVEEILLRFEITRMFKVPRFEPRPEYLGPSYPTFPGLPVFVGPRSLFRPTWSTYSWKAIA